ncbi:MAG: hypothetical protein ACTHMD_16825 [Flavisolibacter sp.]
MSKNQPLYLVPPDSDIVQNWKRNFQKLEQSQDVLVFTVNPTIVDEGQVAWIQQMVLALQHHPHLIERMIFSVKFKFMLVDDVPVELTENEWKMKPEIYRWFYGMSTLPIMVYFINDQDARSYCLAGDIFASGNFTYQQEANSKQLAIQFTMEQLQVIADRLFHSAWALLMYCHATGFNPDTYIDALLADYNMPFTAADVRRQYDEDIEKGMHFRMVPQA